MKKTIIVAGATGNLGKKIIDSLLQEDVVVKAILRPSSDSTKIKALEAKGIEVQQMDMNNIDAMANFFIGANCIVSAIAGLQEVIIDTQFLILKAAVQAHVPRFIVSDFSIDYTDLVPDSNRNLDMRRTFHDLINNEPINAISIFNGAFMDLLVTDMPLILFNSQKILCWGNPKQLMEFTYTQNVASYAAKVAASECNDRYLKIAGDVMCCNDFVNLMTQLENKPYKIFRPGGIGLLNFAIKLTQFFSPSKKELYPAWQGMQYMRDMMEGLIKIDKHDNEKFGSMHWMRIKEFMIAHRNKK